jgi:hypothetical protein
MTAIDLCGWNLSDLAAAAQIAQTIFLFVALFVASLALSPARRQAVEASRARQLNATEVLFELIGNEQVRRIRSWVLDELPNQIPLNISAHERNKIRRLAVVYDRVGYLISQRLLPERPLFDFHADEIGILWYKLSPLIQSIREETMQMEGNTVRKRPNYCQHFEELATTWLPRAQQRFADSAPGIGRN